MPNFIITYDLNGRRPSHKQMDDHLRALGPKCVRGRLLETVWYLAAPMSTAQVSAYAQRILSPNDRLLVVEARNAAWLNLLADGGHFKKVFERNERLAA